MKRTAILCMLGGLVLSILLTGCLKKDTQPVVQEEPEEGGLVVSWELPGQGQQAATDETGTAVFVTIGDKVVDLNDVDIQGLSKATLKTNLGDIKLELYLEDAPTAVISFLKLAKAGYFDGIKFHRVIKGFMIQSGDPNSKDDDWSDDGLGGPGYVFNDEFNDRPLIEGSLGMANSGPNSNGSQFFIVTASSTEWLDGLHTNFGEVIKGMDIVGRIENVQINENAHPLEDVVIQSVELE